MREYVVTVMARDRVGIIRDVSSALTVLGGNITHLSQTVLRGYFTLIISVEMAERTCEEVRVAVEENGDAGEFRVGVHGFVPGGQEPGAPGTEQFTLSMQGKDQPGIIARTTTYLAGRDINVDDFYAYVHEGILLMLAQVSIPVGVDVERVQVELEHVGEEFGLVVHLQHEDIFRATSDVRPMGQK